MLHDLNSLIEKAKSVQMTESQREEQRRSFAFGNGNLSNQRVSRDSVDQEAERMAKEDAEGSANEGGRKQSSRA